MKTNKMKPMILLVLEFYFLKIADFILHPFENIPGLEVNDVYDDTML